MGRDFLRSLSQGVDCDYGDGCNTMMMGGEGPDLSSINGQV